MMANVHHFTVYDLGIPLGLRILIEWFDGKVQSRLKAKEVVFERRVILLMPESQVLAKG